MTMAPDLSGLSKKDLVRRIEELDKRRQAQIARQIDSINRLLGNVQQTGVYRYEHELMTLNEQLALADVRRTALEAALRKVTQMIGDKLATTTSGKEHTFLDRLYQVLVTEAGIDPYHDEHGRTSEGDQPTDDEDHDGQAARVDTER